MKIYELGDGAFNKEVKNKRKHKAGIMNIKTFIGRRNK